MQNPQRLIERFMSRVHVLDGGLATELERRGHDVSGKLWSAQVLLDEPGAIEQLHYDYLKAGADIIITSSYQLTFQGMKEAGYTHKQAEDALFKSVEVATNARDRYLSELDEDLPEDRKPLIAASIGPYGAYLADGGEYREYGDTGVPPVRSGGVSPSGTGRRPAQHTPGTGVSLSDFHRERFDLLAASPADLVAFETTPDVNEVNAYFSLLERRPGIPGWITASRTESASATLNGQDVIPLANVVGLGANCVAPSQATAFIRSVAASPVEVPVIVYPNSGEGWDAEHRCWVGENDSGQFAEYAREWINAGANIIGGCCRTGPEHIAQLRKLVDAMN